MTDRMSPVPDVKFRPVGMAHQSLFRCAACGNPRQCLGRRLQRVHGLRQWVCKGCAK